MLIYACKRTDIHYPPRESALSLYTESKMHKRTATTRIRGAIHKYTLQVLLLYWRSSVPFYRAPPRNLRSVRERAVLEISSDVDVAVRELPLFRHG